MSLHDYDILYIQLASMSDVSLRLGHMTYLHMLNCGLPAYVDDRSFEVAGPNFGINFHLHCVLQTILFRLGYC